MFYKGTILAATVAGKTFSSFRRTGKLVCHKYSLDVSFFYPGGGKQSSYSSHILCVCYYLRCVSLLVVCFNFGNSIKIL